MAGRTLLAVVLALLIALTVPLGPGAAVDPGADGPWVAPMGLGDDPPRMLNATYVAEGWGPSIDGVVSPGEWGAAEGTSALWSERPPAWEETGAHIAGPGIQSDADASHAFWALYDDQWLYMLFNCTDDYIYVDSYPASYWRDDSIEVCIDGAHDKDLNQRTDDGWEDGDTFNVPADGRDGIAYSYANGNVHAREWGPDADWYSVATNHSTYYVVELCVRLSTIASPRPGDTMGLDTGQNDDDDGGLTKEGVIRWTGVDGVQVWSNETVWGDLYLRTAVTADAGDDVQVDQGTHVMFDGSGSWGNHPGFATSAVYNWTFQYDGQDVSLQGFDPSFTFDIPGRYVVTLNVTDETGVGAEDTVVVTVRDTEAPVARAGEDATIDQGTLYTFDGSLSTDNDPAHPGGLALTWTLLDGGEVVLHGPNPAHTFESPGVFDVELNVTDAAGNFGLDTVTITVRDTEMPVALAGPDVEVDEDEEVGLDATASTDNVGIVAYAWEFLVGVTPVTLSGAQAVYTFTEPGVYEVTLTVTDAAGLDGTDTVTVTVRDVTPPVADAGGGRTVDEDTEVTLDGSGSYDNAAIATFHWMILLGSTNLDELDGMAPKYTFAEPGVYTVTLMVRDASDLVGMDSATYIVLDTTAPVADAGGDQSVDEDVEVTLDGTGSHDNVGIVGHTWTIARDGATLETLTGQSPTYTFVEPGVYNVTLRVTDAADLSATDTVVYTILDATRPVVDAGGDMTVDEDVAVALDGSASSDNTGIETYSWTITKGGYVVISLDGVNPTHTFGEPGVYTVTLFTIDAAGNQGSDTINVTVRDTTPPLPHGSASVDVKTGEVATFDGQPSSDNVGITSYVWTIVGKDLNERLEGANVTYTFKKAGTYNATLTVTDAAGNNASAWWDVKVVKPKKDEGPGPVAWMAAGALAAVALAARRRR
jgi:PKD repeat protein